MEPWVIMVIVIVVIVIIIAILYFSGMFSGGTTHDPDDPPINLTQTVWAAVLDSSYYVETYKGFAIYKYEQEDGDLQYYWTIDSTHWFRQQPSASKLRAWLDQHIGG